MSLQYIFVITYVGMHQSEVYELWIVRVVEAGSNAVYVVMTQVSSVTAEQSCSSLHVTTYFYFHIAFYIYALISTTSTVTILCICPIMHDKLITYCSALLKLILRIHMRMRITGRCKGYNDLGLCFLPVHMANLISQCKNSLSLL